MIRIKDWHLVISGFTQHEGRMHGCLRLAQELRALSSPQTFVGLREWDSNWERIAEHMQLVSDWNDRDPVIRLYAYSWGCGNGVVQLAEQLAMRGLKIQHVVMADPVYYSRLPLWLARGIGVLRRGTVDVPANIQRVSWLRQFKNIPGGCDLRAVGDATAIEAPIELQIPHEQVDDAEAFHALALKVAGLS